MDNKDFKVRKVRVMQQRYWFPFILGSTSDYYYYFFVRVSALCFFLIRECMFPYNLLHRGVRE